MTYRIPGPLVEDLLTLDGNSLLAAGAKAWEDHPQPITWSAL